MSRLVAFVVSLLPSADLPLAMRFYIGAVLIVTVWVIVGTLSILVPTLGRDLVALFRELFRSEPAKVVQIDEHRRRMQLDAAAGRRAS